MTDRHEYVVSQLNDEYDTPEEVAEACLRALGRSWMRTLAFNFLVDEVKDYRRREVKKIEQSAERQVSKKKPRTVGIPNGDGTYRWIPQDGEEYRRIQAERDEKRWAEYEAAREESNRRIQQAFDDYKQELRMEWTKELLDSKFALPDGTMVTWGEATLEHHNLRIAMLSQNVEGNLQAIKRHEEAIRSIGEVNDAHCLDDAA